MKLYLLYIFPIIIPTVCFGQINVLYPDQPSVWFNSKGLINPAFIPEDVKTELIASYKHRTGPFQKIATYSILAGKIIGKENKSSHLIRGIFINEKEGPYIQKPRVYLNYGLLIHTSEKSELSAGASLGITQVAFTAPSASAFGSATFPDGNIGLMYRSKNFESGFSIMQAFNAQSAPLQSLLTLHRYYNLYLTSKKELNSDVCIIGNALVQLFPKDEDEYNGSIEVRLKNIFSVGSGIRINSGLYFLSSLHLPFSSGNLLISFTYNSPLLNPSNISGNSLEFNGGFFAE